MNNKKVNGEPCIPTAIVTAKLDATDVQYFLKWVFSLKCHPKDRMIPAIPGGEGGGVFLDGQNHLVAELKHLIYTF